MKRWSPFGFATIKALLFGAALTFAFAPYDIFPFAVVAPAGLIWLSRKSSPRQAFYFGFMFGLGFFGTGVYWVYISMHRFGGVSFALACGITSLFIMAMALFPACTNYLSSRFFSRHFPSRVICAFPALWVISEWVRSWMLSGFPWLLIGYSQINSPLKGFAPIFSVYGVSLAVLLSSGFLLNTYDHFRQQQYKKTYVHLSLLLCLWLIGSALSFIPWTQASGEKLAVSLVQGDIPQQIKWSPTSLQLSLDRYAHLSAPEWKANQVIIWPEAAVPLALQDARDFIQSLSREARKSQAQLITGIPIRTTNGQYYNALVNLGATLQVYNKRLLVPFGEYIPLAQWFARFFAFMDIPMSDMKAGQASQPPFLINGTKILPFICYEIAFPELVNFDDVTIGALLTVTNDAWFGESAAQAQHLEMAQMRAVEVGRPVLFVSNDGITALITAKGLIQAAAPPHQPFVLNGTIETQRGRTPWMKNGLDPLLFLSLCFLYIAMRFNSTKKPKSLATLFKKSS